MTGCSFTKRYPISELRGFEIDALNSGHCKAYLVPGFVIDREEVSITTYHEGYISVDRIEFADTIQILNMLIKIVEDLIDSVDHLIPDHRFSYELASVFYSPRINSVKLEYSLNGHEDRDLAHLVNEIRKRYRGNDIGCIDDLLRYINRNDPGLKDRRMRLIRYKREALFREKQKP